MPTVLWVSIASFLEIKEFIDFSSYINHSIYAIPQWTIGRIDLTGKCRYLGRVRRIGRIDLSNKCKKHCGCLINEKFMMHKTEAITAGRMKILKLHLSNLTVLTPSLWHVKPVELNMEFFEEEDDDEPLVDFFFKWVHEKKNPLQKLQKLHIIGWDWSDLISLHSLTDLKELFLENIGTEAVEVFLKLLPKRLTRLTIHDLRSRPQNWGNALSFCEFQALFHLQYLRVLSLEVFPNYVPLLFQGCLPYLVALHLQSDGSWLDDDIEVGGTTRCSFPRVQELAMEGDLPHALILSSIGKELTHLTIGARKLQDYEDLVDYYSNLFLVGRERFPNLLEIQAPVNIHLLPTSFQDVTICNQRLYRKHYNVGPRFFNYTIQTEDPVYV